MARGNSTLRSINAYVNSDISGNVADDLFTLCGVITKRVLKLSEDYEISENTIMDAVVKFTDMMAHGNLSDHDAIRSKFE